MDKMQLWLQVQRIDYEFGRNTTNPMGRRIVVWAEGNGRIEEIRLYLFAIAGPDYTFVGWRATQGHLVVFLPESDYAGVALVLDQIRATTVHIDLDPVTDDILNFELLSRPATQAATLPTSDADDNDQLQRRGLLRASGRPVR